MLAVSLAFMEHPLPATFPISSGGTTSNTSGVAESLAENAEDSRLGFVISSFSVFRLHALPLTIPRSLPSQPHSFQPQSSQFLDRHSFVFLPLPLCAFVQFDIPSASHPPPGNFFPIIGKPPKNFSNHWKTQPELSNHWKKTFQSLENPPPPAEPPDCAPPGHLPPASHSPPVVKAHPPAAPPRCVK